MKIEREKLELEREKLETQHQHEQELEKIRLQHEEEMLSLQKDLELQYKVKEQEQQQEATRAEALKLKMLLDQTNSERAKTYRQALHADPHISHLQILDMSHLLEVTSIYVRARPTLDDASLWETTITLLFETLTTSRYTLTQAQTAETLADIGGTKINTQLLHLLSDKQINDYVPLSIAEVLGKLADTEQNIQDLVELLATSDLADEIHRALWSASRQADVRIYMSDGQMGQLLRIVTRVPLKAEHAFFVTNCQMNCQ